MFFFLNPTGHAVYRVDAMIQDTAEEFRAIWN